MKRILMATLVIGISMMATAADSVQPASVTYTNARTDAEMAVGNGDIFYYGTTLRLTNCLCLTVGGATQGLDSVTVSITVGNGTTYTNTVTAGVSGNTWSANVLVPTSAATIFLQTKLTDVNTNVYIYPWKRIPARASL
jgi:uncharacterized protein YraI